MHVRFVAIHVQAFLDLGVSKRRLDGAKSILDQTPRSGVLEMLGFSSDRPFLEEQAWRVRVGLRHVREGVRDEPVGRRRVLRYVVTFLYTRLESVFLACSPPPYPFFGLSPFLIVLGVLHSFGHRLGVFYRAPCVSAWFLHLWTPFGYSFGVVLLRESGVILALPLLVRGF